MFCEYFKGLLAVQDKYEYCDLLKFDFNCFITAKHTTNLKYIKPNV